MRDSDRTGQLTAGTDPMARMARSANAVVYAMVAVAAGLGVMTGADPWALALIAASVAPLAVEGAGVRVPPLVGGLVTLAAIGAAQGVGTPKMVLLIPVAMAAWVALRSSSALVNAVYLVGTVGLSVLWFVSVEPAPAGNYISSGSVVWAAAAGYGTASGYILRRTGELAEELARAQHRIVTTAASEERRRIAQDVHDLVAHSLAVALLNVTGARRTMRRDPALADEALARAEAVGRESLNGIRQVVGLLREDGHVDPRPPGATGADAGPGVGPLPDAHDLVALIDGYRAGGLPVELRIDGSLDGLDAVAGSVLFRTVREALANVSHHAAGAVTDIEIGVAAGSVRVAVTNPLPPGWQRRSQRRGLGLTGVVERVNALGGTVSAGADDGAWQLAAVIPRVPTPLAAASGDAGG
ncbi:histidine kinase [Frankia sp. AgPm24]|uniref:histidine kinase n=1 Tax=Frankia umida TaxID=573489 RepID=A0ABT0JZT8_9ACTN|nr:MULTISPECIES: histidine kinase [Frankia]MCK9877049.1 histidine kinase [Frankia umida]MCK9923027.1 histidine kinase [Frankia sp. AgPm24]